MAGKKEAIDYKAVSAAALRGALEKVEAGLESLPDEGGTEPDVVKGARGTLLGARDGLRATLGKVEG